MHFARSIVLRYHSIPKIKWGSFRGRHHFGLVWDHFRVGDHFGVGIISGAVHIKQSNNNKRDRRENNRTILTKHMSELANLRPIRSSVVIDRTKSGL